MHCDHDFVYHLTAQQLAKSDYTADSEDQSDAGYNEGQLLNVIGDF